MKAVREYNVEGNYLHCTVTFLPDQQELDESEELVFSPLHLSALVSYPFKPGEHPTLEDMSPYMRRLQVNGSPNISPALVLAETIRFCQTIKLMYDL